MVRPGSHAPAAPAALVMVLALLAAGCAAGVPSPRTLAATAPPALDSAAVALRPGETLVYEVSAGPFDGGRVVVATGAAPAARPDLAVVSARIATSGLVALLDHSHLTERTWIDVASGLPVLFRSRRAGSGPRSAVEAVFNDRRADIDLTKRSGRTVVRAHQRVPGGAAFNLYSALYALRTWSRGPARPATLDVLARSRLWRVTVRRGAVEFIATDHGAERVVRINCVAWRTLADGRPDLHSNARRFRLFFSTDRTRRPVRLEVDARYGVVRADLVSYRAGRTPRARVQRRASRSAATVTATASTALPLRVPPR